MKAVIFSILVAALSPAIACAGLDAKSLAAIRRCRDFIRSAQVDDGAFRVEVKGDAVRISPYFGNVSAQALVVAYRLEHDEKDLDAARRWIDWYAGHARADGTILDFLGTTKAYESSPKRDSIDVYPPTYLAALSRYHRVRPDDVPADEMQRRAELALRATENSIDPADGMAWSSVPHRYKYPMDNIEICIGLIEGAQLFDSMGLHAQADHCRAILTRSRSAVASFWLSDRGHFAWMKGGTEKTRTFEKGYPDGVVNIYLAATIDPPPPHLWQNLIRQFADVPRLTPDLWLAAARRCGSPAEVDHYAQIAIARTQGNPALDLQVASRLLLALAGDVAEPTRVPLDLPTSSPASQP